MSVPRNVSTNKSPTVPPSMAFAMVVFRISPATPDRIGAICSKVMLLFSS